MSISNTWWNISNGGEKKFGNVQRLIQNLPPSLFYRRNLSFLPWCHWMVLQDAGLKCKHFQNVNTTWLQLSIPPFLTAIAKVFDNKCLKDTMRYGPLRLFFFRWGSSWTCTDAWSIKDKLAGVFAGKSNLKRRISVFRPISQEASFSSQRPSGSVIESVCRHLVAELC